MGRKARVSKGKQMKPNFFVFCEGETEMAYVKFLHLDVEGMLEHLQKIPNAELLVSNPCIELWFLLHYQEQKLEISSDKCVQKYQKFRKDTKRVLCLKKKSLL